jgi:hypothetical protein
MYTRRHQLSTRLYITVPQTHTIFNTPTLQLSTRPHTTAHQTHTLFNTPTLQLSTRLHTTAPQTRTLFKSLKPPLMSSLSLHMSHLQYPANVGIKDRRGRHPRLRAIVMANLVKAVILRDRVV